MKVKEFINELTKFNLEAEVVAFAHFQEEPFTMSWDAIVPKSEAQRAVIYLDRLNYSDKPTIKVDLSDCTLKQQCRVIKLLSQEKIKLSVE